MWMIVLYNESTDMHSIHYIPLLADMSYIANEYLETTINWVPGIQRNFIERFSPVSSEPTRHYAAVLQEECGRAKHASAIILNTLKF